MYKIGGYGQTATVQKKQYLSSPLPPVNVRKTAWLQGFSYVKNAMLGIGGCCHFAQKGKVNGLFMFNYKQS